MSRRTLHPIEAESYRILARRVDLGTWPPGEAAVVARVLHASADLEYASSMVFGSGAVAAGVNALRAGAVFLTDVEMVRAGITGARAECMIPGSEAGATAGAVTRAAVGIRSLAARHPAGAVVVVGCAPTALAEVVRLALEEGFRPALVVGLPVGFVGAAEAKEQLRSSGIASISNVGDKGGSAVAAAAANALVHLACEGAPR